MMLSRVETISRGVALGRDAVQLPVVPGLGIHHRLGVEGPGVEVVRVGPPEFAHGLGEGFVEAMAVGLAVGVVAGGEGLDPGPLPGAGLGLQGPGPAQRLPGRRDRVRRHRQVDVRPEREGDAPPAHGAVRIQPGGLAERADRLGVIEAEHQVDALVEEHLGLRVLGRDRVLVDPQALEHRRPGLVRLAGVDLRHRRHGHLAHAGHGLVRQDRARGQHRRRAEAPQDRMFHDRPPERGRA